jgi:aconitate hydratase 2/2-methylisocitrate dehydratase/2-methylcitrate dehydratase
MQGEMGYPSALTAKTWGFYDVLFKGNTFKFQRSYGSYVMEQVLFKISFPAEFHAQTAVECAIQLHAQVGKEIQTLEQIAQIDKIVITTHESAIRIIDKTGPLDNPADRDHCIQYMSAIGLLKGNLSAQDYENAAASDPRIDAIREKMICVEKSEYTADYLNPEKRSIANAIQIFFKDSTSSDNIAVEYPIGHRRRRDQGIPELVKKFQVNLARRFDAKKQADILALCLDQAKLEATSVNTFVDMLVV